MDERWLTVRQAANLLTERCGFEVSDTRVRRLAYAGQLKVWMVSAQLCLYDRASVEQCEVVRKRQPRLCSSV